MNYHGLSCLQVIIINVSSNNLAGLCYLGLKSDCKSGQARAENDGDGELLTEIEEEAEKDRLV
jgi:hypothetical protein